MQTNTVRAGRTKRIYVMYGEVETTGNYRTPVHVKAKGITAYAYGNNEAESKATAKAIAAALRQSLTAQA